MIKLFLTTLLLISISSCAYFDQISIQTFEIEKLKNRVEKLEKLSSSQFSKIDSLTTQLQTQKASVDNAIEKIQYQGGGSIAKEILFDKFPIFSESKDKNYSYAISLLDSSRFNDAEYTANFIIDKYLKTKDNAKMKKKSQESQTTAADVIEQQKTYVYTLYLRGYLRYVQKKYQESVEDFSYIAKNYPDSEVADNAILGLLFGYDRLGNSAKGCALSRQILEIYKTNTDMYGKFNDKISKLHFVC